MDMIVYKKKELRTEERETKTLGLCEQIKRVGLDPAMEKQRERERGSERSGFSKNKRK